MRIFVTGATGFIGSVTVRELLGAGHQVLGLVRSDANAEALAATGATVVRGSLEDLDALRRGAAAADGVIHTAFIHSRDFADFARACAVDQRAIATIGDVLAGSNRPLVITSGTPAVAGGAAATERDTGVTNPISVLRSPAEDLTLALAGRGVRSSIVRLPRSVHGAAAGGWRGGFTSVLVGMAQAKGVSAYIGDGAQRWPAVHRLDAARLYRLAVEKAPAGARLHAVGDEGIAMRDLAAAIGRRLGLPVVAKTGDEVAAHFGFLGTIGALDQPASCAHTRELLGWAPRELGLLADFAANYA
ncbi:MAG TPA: SDR family oxidoreductase [Polyangia bacterium]|nr:SDR family oxidoreductase [Polyangia bacterium]